MPAGIINMETELSRKFEKIVVNAGIGRLATQANFNKKSLEEVTREFALITGQKPQERPAKQSIAGFKVRAGAIVGLKSTLRRKRMAAFIAKLVKVVLPRIRDFRGIDLKNIDKGGNLTIGIKENLVFPEINPETAKYNFGVEITFVPRSAKSKEKAVGIYKEIGIPFKKV